MPQLCSVRGCKSVLRKNSGISFHCFPKDEKMRQLWLSAADMGVLKWDRRPRVCSKHFKKEDFVFGGNVAKLSSFAIPNVKLENTMTNIPIVAKTEPAIGTSTPPNATNYNTLNANGLEAVINPKHQAKYSSSKVSGEVSMTWCEDSENDDLVHEEEHIRLSTKIVTTLPKITRKQGVNRVTQTPRSSIEPSLKMTWISESSNQAEDGMNTLTSISGNLLQCEFCNRTFSDKLRLVLHQRSHSVQCNYVCCTCLTQFDSYPNATSHWNTQCTEYSNEFCLTKSLYCEFCDRTFRTHECLYIHKTKKKHITPKLNEDVSFETLKTAGYWDELITDLSKRISNADKENMRKNESNTLASDENHNLSSPEPKKKRRTRNKSASDPRFRYQCERCIKHFDTIANLEQHRTKEHANMFMCMECGVTMASSKSLVIHDRCHKKLKPYVCDVCSKSYSQTSHLWQHMRFHKGIKPFACPHEGCDARYTIRPDLKDHIRKVHTKERPFQCTWCHKSFLTGSVFYQHRLIHTNDRRYECNVCLRRFFRADALNNHKRIHTNERPFKCEICHKNFRQKGDRNKHVKTQHPDVSVTQVIVDVE